MPIELNTKDYDQLSERLSLIKFFADINTRQDFISNMLATQPGRDALRRILTNPPLGNPPSAAGTLVRELTEFGEHITGRQALCILLETIYPALSSEYKEEIRGLFERYPLTRAFPHLPSGGGQGAGNRKRIFVSYAEPDAGVSIGTCPDVGQLAETLYNALNDSTGMDTSIEIRGSVPPLSDRLFASNSDGADLRVLAPGLDAADCLVVLLSRNYLRSPRAMAELRAFQDSWYKRSPGRSDTDMPVLFLETEELPNEETLKPNEETSKPTELAIVKDSNRLRVWNGQTTISGLADPLCRILNLRRVLLPKPDPGDLDNPLAFVFYHATERVLADKVCALLDQNLFDWKRPWDEADAPANAQNSAPAPDEDILMYCKENVLSADAIFILWGGEDSRYRTAVLRWAERQVDFCRPLVRRRSKGWERPFMDSAGVLWGAPPPPKKPHFAVPSPQFCFIDSSKAFSEEEFSEYLRQLRSRLLRFRQGPPSPLPGVAGAAAYQSGVGQPTQPI